MGKRLYRADAYQLRDLELALKEAEENAERTDQQREQLRVDKVLEQQVVSLYQQGKHGDALKLAMLHQYRIGGFGHGESAVVTGPPS